MVQAKDMEQKAASIVVWPNIAVTLPRPGPGVLSIVLFTWDSDSGDIHTKRVVRKRLEFMECEDVWAFLETLARAAIRVGTGGSTPSAVQYTQALLNTATLEELLANRLTAEWQRFVAGERVPFLVWREACTYRSFNLPAVKHVFEDAVGWVL